MPRYNTSLANASISGSTTIGSPYSGAFTELTGTAPYTVTLPSPALYPGSNQTFYNASSGAITLTTPSGIFTGTGGSGTNTVNCFMGNVVSVTSDGTNYVVISEDGSALVATTGTFSGDVSLSGAGASVSISPNIVTMSPTGGGNINNVNIGVTTRGTGAFTTLAANGQTTLTANITSTNTASGTLVVTGGIGASGTINTSALSASSITGTLQTAAQPNINSVNTLAINRGAPILKLHVVANTNGAIALDLIDSTTTSSLMDAGSTNNIIYVRTAFNSNPGAVSNAGAKWGIAFTGQPAGDNTSYPINASSSALGKSASIYAVSEDTGAGYNRTVGLGLWTSDFDQNQTEKIRITGPGTVGIGTPTPQTKLDINGNLIARGDLFFGTLSSNTLTTSPSNTAWHHIGYAGGTNYHVTGSTTGDMTIGALPGTGIIFGTAISGSPVPIHRMYIRPDGLVGVNTTDFSYLSNDNTPVVGSNTSNRLFVNGSIQLLNNDDALVIGRGTATFLKDEELGFGWGGGWYMNDSTWLRVRNSKIIQATGGISIGGFYTYNFSGNYSANTWYTLFEWNNLGWDGAVMITGYGDTYAMGGGYYSMQMTCPSIVPISTTGTNNADVFSLGTMLGSGHAPNSERWQLRLAWNYASGGGAGSGSAGRLSLQWQSTNSFSGASWGTAGKSAQIIVRRLV